jgi:7,8-dihydropterin-6-yl-methyl-4-(beta-D-ribofuranosyl)aminobenzene 5'-phosphate synthase
MTAVKKEYEATGGKFIEHEESAEILPPAGLVEDTIPEDQSLVLKTPEGLVVVTGCGHAGI